MILAVLKGSKKSVVDSAIYSSFTICLYIYIMQNLDNLCQTNAFHTEIQACFSIEMTTLKRVAFYKKRKHIQITSFRESNSF